MKNRALMAGVALLASLGLVALSSWRPAQAPAADHNDPPDASGDTAADIADFYAWHDADGNMVVVLSIAGASMPVADQTGTYDADVLYGIHFSDTGSGGDPLYEATHDIWVRFGANDAGDWGMQVMNLPGEDDMVVGAVETPLTAPNGAMAWVGLADDPFFFDLEGFQDTVTTGDLSFASLAAGGSARDSLMGTNATTIVLQFPASDVTSAGGMVHTWATTGRTGS